jgi:uncharacterized protein YjgD (DUF1641 family)
MNPLSNGHANSIESSSIDSSSMITHFQRLFDCPTTSGIYPKMNELFIFINEIRPALNEIRQLLQLDENTPIHTILNTLRSKLTQSSSISEPPYISSSSPTQSLKNSLTYFNTCRTLKKLLHVSNTRDLVPLIERLLLRQYDEVQNKNEMKQTTIHKTSKSSSEQILLKQICTILKIESISEIIPSLNSMYSRSNMIDELLPAVDNLVSQLYSLLHVENISEIIPALRNLLELANQNSIKISNDPLIEHDISPISNHSPILSSSSSSSDSSPHVRRPTTTNNKHVQ